MPEKDLAALRLEDYVRRVVAAAPPLTDEQRTRLAELVRPARRAADRQTVAEWDGVAC